MDILREEKTNSKSKFIYIISTPDHYK